MAEDKKGKKSLFSRHRYRHESPARQTGSIRQDTAPRQPLKDTTTNDALGRVPPKLPQETSKPRSDYSTDKLLLWREAYEALKDDAETQSMVLQYEDFLRDPANGLVENATELQGQPELEQMKMLLGRSLERTARMDKFDRGLGLVIDTVLTVKDIVGTALSSVPIAAAAWTPICIALEFLVKSPHENQENRDGIVEVVNKMRWYSNMSLLLLDDTPRNQDIRYHDLRLQLASRIRDLYKAILDYIITTVYEHHKHAVSRFTSRMFGSWKDKLDAILKAEKTATDFASQKCDQQMNTQLQLLVDFHLTEAESGIMSKLSVRNMFDEMTALEKRKDKLIPNSYSWISGKPQYKQFLVWDTTRGSRMLWIKGAAGTGKTMIVIGLIRELHGHFNLPCLCYFFCQGSNDELNTATAILKGLMAMLIRQNKSLFQHVFKEINASGDRFLTANDAFPTLSRIFLDMIRDQMLERAVFVVDALDECKHCDSHDSVAGLVDLLDLISETIQVSDKVKWLVSGRNIEQIANALGNTEQHKPDVKALQEYESIEVNRESAAEAVDLFIERKVSELKEKHVRKVEGRVPKSKQKMLEEKEKALNDVGKVLRDRTDGTFLWVSLVFRELKDCEPRKMLATLDNIPSELKKVYARMIQRINASPHKESYQRAISAAVLAYRPLSVVEMMMFANEAPPGEDADFLENSGLLTVRDGVVNLLHQSTLDYLKERPDDDIRGLFPGAYTDGHAEILKSSLKAMGSDLAEDMRSKSPATPRKELSDLEYLVAVRYSCRYWINHFCDMPDTTHGPDLYDEILAFLKVHLLEWLVAICLMQKMPSALLSIRKLQKLLHHKQTNPQLSRLVDDADRFCRLTKDGIEEYPLQVYCAASLFTPAGSMIRELFQAQRPDFIANTPAMEDDWHACQQTYTFNGDFQGFSLENGKFVTKTTDSVEFVDLHTGARSQWFEPSFSKSQGIVFSPNGGLLALVNNENVDVWNVLERKELSKIEVVAAGESLCAVRFSPSKPEIAIGIEDLVGSWRVSIYDVEDNSLGAPVLEVAPDGHPPYGFNGLAYSSDGKSLATAGATVQVWDVETGICKSVVIGHVPIASPSLSADGKLLAVVVERNADLSIWNIETRSASLLRKFNPYEDEGLDDISLAAFTSVAFLPDSQLVAASSGSGSIHLLDIRSGDPLARLGGHGGFLYSLSCSKDGTLLASASVDCTVKLWTIPKSQSSRGSSHGFTVDRISMSPNTMWFASSSTDSVKVWDVDGTCVRTLAGETSNAEIAISPGGDLFATVHYIRASAIENSNGKSKIVQKGSDLKVWDKNGCSCNIIRDAEMLGSVHFSPCGTMIASGAERSVKVWNLADKSFKWNTERVKPRRYLVSPMAVAFSADGELIATGDHSDSFVKIWYLSDGREKDEISLRDMSESTVNRALKSLAFCQNGERLLSNTMNDRLQVWDLKRKTLMHSFDWNSNQASNLMFINNGPLISSSRGVFTLPPDSSPDSTSTEEMAVQLQGPGISDDDEWITWDGDDLLWLPPPYRPMASAVRSRTVVIGCGSGQVYVITFKDDFDGIDS
ncbi:hypothetical protein M409DRAFT_18533 [Zasmidium cellare ATCC 36951]|uniref:NACHT domain-containing protein n=1 Tax=Zasmidium cellare ATCC 36951 TaxID=1080233 RepID=A0A6A6CW45_ZASCE|nr:uncharacterized protein M409DRAFT_18533 [Zasmidium cellare ATCC 36951]KAF2171417.1 hypothetical protein M409DRAFT_18533 [Zasmidium cellare ATCC 36951]